MDSTRQIPAATTVDQSSVEAAGEWSEPEDAGTAPAPLGEPDGTEGSIIEPFDPTLIRVRSQTMTVDLLLSRIEYGEIHLTPEFQRHEVWNEVARSRLIESALIRIPLPALYMDATDEDRWLVIDGLQRLSTFHRFVTLESLRLTGLEFLRQFDGRGYADLPRTFQRRIGETQMDVYLIDKGTPAAVKYNIFKRINTGGMPLSAQEIRHALNQGPATELLKRLAESPEFKQATRGSVKPKRMDDREAVLRALAFMITPYTSYRSGDFDAFLHEAMAKLNSMAQPQVEMLASDFLQAMDAARHIVGRHAFRKMYPWQDALMPVNKALFETLTVALAQCTPEELERLVEDRERVVGGLMHLLTTDDNFMAAISAGTGDRRKVERRFRAVEGLVRGVLA